MGNARRFIFLFFIIHLLNSVLGTSFFHLYGQWAVNGLPICTLPENQKKPRVAVDDKGGAIFVWYDVRGGSADIYAQRTDTLGFIQWTENGVSVCSTSGDQFRPVTVGDGMGGSFITWYDNRNGVFDIYAQRINSSGTAQWIPNGVRVSTRLTPKIVPEIISDGVGGVIIVWNDDNTTFSGLDLYAQRIDSSGRVLWDSNGVAVCTASGWQVEHVIVGDGKGGVIVAWRDFFVTDVFAQRVSADGVVLWGPNGIPICTVSGGQLLPTVVSDGSGGAIIAWEDNRSVAGGIYAQRLDTSGAIQWIPNGIPVCTAPGYQRGPVAVGDGMGGAIIAWADERNGFSNTDIFAQRINASGTPQWTTDGVPICLTEGHQHVPKIVSDGRDGAIIVWRDGWEQYDVYGQRVDSSGITGWVGRGIPICNANLSQDQHAVVSDGFGGAIIAWEDQRSGNQMFDVYALRIDNLGNIVPVIDLPTLSEKYRLDQNFPNPFNPTTTINYQLPEASHVTLRVYDVLGRTTRTLVDEPKEAGYYRIDVNLSSVASGVYFYRMLARSISGGTAGKYTSVKKLLLTK